MVNRTEEERGRLSDWFFAEVFPRLNRTDNTSIEAPGIVVLFDKYLATPFWDDINGIPFAVCDEETGETVWETVLNFPPDLINTQDAQETARNYLAFIRGVIALYEATRLHPD